MILGQLRMGARQAKNAPLSHDMFFRLDLSIKLPIMNEIILIRLLFSISLMILEIILDIKLM